MKSIEKLTPKVDKLLWTSHEPFCDKDADGLKVVTLKSKIDALRAKHPSAPLITFSHFVPKIDLTPEKRYLFWANLAKATGSIYLGKRIDELQPTCHCFGHTHFG